MFFLFLFWGGSPAHRFFLSRAAVCYQGSFPLQGFPFFLGGTFIAVLILRSGVLLPLLDTLLLDGNSTPRRVPHLLMGVQRLERYPTPLGILSSLSFPFYVISPSHTMSLTLLCYFRCVPICWVCIVCASFFGRLLHHWTRDTSAP